MKKKLREKKKKKISTQRLVTYIIGLSLVMLMVGSGLNMAGYFGGDEATVEYNGQKFISSDEGWITYKDNRPIVIQSDPELLTLIDTGIEANIRSIDFSQKIYFSNDPRDNIQAAFYDFTRNLQFSNTFVPACTVDIPECADYPLKTCDDATPDIGVIIFKESNESKVTFFNNCLVVQGDYENLTMITDKLILDTLGV